MSPTFLATRGGALLRASRHDDDGWRVEEAMPAQGFRSLAASPRRPGSLLAGAGTSGVFRSDDAGATWRRLARDGRDVTAVAWSATEDDVLYAGTKPAALLVSRDGGATWREAGPLAPAWQRRTWWTPSEPPGVGYVQAVAPSADDPRLLLVGVEGVGGVRRSEDGGETWSASRGAIMDCHSLAAHARDGRTFVEGGAGARACMVVSRDGGRSWRRPRAPAGLWYGWAAALDADEPDLLYFSTSPGPFQAHRAGAARAGIYRMRGDGMPERLAGGLPDPLPNMPYALLTDARWPGHVWAGMHDGEVWESPDRGATWRRLFSFGGVERAMALA